MKAKATRREKIEHVESTASEQAQEKPHEQAQEPSDHERKRPSRTKGKTMPEDDSINTRDNSSRGSELAHRVGESETCAREKTG